MISTSLPADRSWQSLGNGPLQIRAYEGQVVYAISDSTPATGAAGFVLDRGRPQDVRATGAIWARAETATGAIVLSQSISL